MLRIVSQTDTGVMRQQNQDCAKSGALADGTIWSVVCDGMGGTVGGAIASKLVVDAFEQSVDEGLDQLPSGSLKNFLEVAISRANNLMIDKIMEQPELAGMGTTLVACVVKDSVAHIAHVGDSRAYLLQKDDIVQLTRDHSMVQVLVDQGQISPEEAKNHPKRNVITRAVGINRNIDIDYDEIPLQDGDILLLCTDGVTGHIDDRELWQLVREHDFFDAAQALIDEANARGGSDNSTAVLIG